jgi:hypothetical protein
MIWEHPRHSIEFTLQVARDYAARHGHLAPRCDERFGGMRLGRWIAERRREARADTLPTPYRRALQDINPWWNATWQADWQRTYAAGLAAARAGTLTFPDLHPRTAQSPLTRWLDQQIAALPALHPHQHNLLGALPLHHPLALLLRRPRGIQEWAFARGLRHAREFRRTHHHLNVPYAHLCGARGSFFRLGEWISDKRRHPRTSLANNSTHWKPSTCDGSPSPAPPAPAPDRVPQPAHLAVFTEHAAPGRADPPEKSGRSTCPMTRLACSNTDREHRPLTAASPVAVIPAERRVPLSGPGMADFGETSPTSGSSETTLRIWPPRARSQGVEQHVSSPAFRVSGILCCPAWMRGC